MGVKYCNQHVVCVFVCLSVWLHISNTIYPNFNKFSICCLWPWLGPFPMTVQYVMYFSFVDDVMISHMEWIGQNKRWRAFFVQFARWRHQSDVKQYCLAVFATWRHRGRSLLSLAASYSILVIYLVIYLVQPHRQLMQPARPRDQRTSPRKSPSGCPWYSTI